MTHSMKPNRYCAQGNCPRDTNSPKSLQLVQTSQGSYEPARPWFASRLVLVPGEKNNLFSWPLCTVFSNQHSSSHMPAFVLTQRPQPSVTAAPPWRPCWCSLNLVLGLGFSKLHHLCSFYFLGWKLWSRSNLQHWGKRGWRSLGA